MILLETKNLKKYFKTGRGLLHAVDDVSFSIQEGATLGIVGESGCGKSTLGRTIIHLLEPTAGEIYFRGEDVTRVTKGKLKELRKNMQMIFQDPYSSLNPRMNVFDLIAEPLLIYRVCANAQALEERVYHLMDTVGLEMRWASSYPHEMDGGRRQRIGIARALALHPSLIVCDEPVSALDVSIQAQIINLLQDLQQELHLTLVFITHDMSVVRHISDQLMVMYLGTVVEYADSEEVFQRQIHPYTRALMDAVPVAKISTKKDRQLLQGEISSPINPPDNCRFSKRCPHVKEICLEKMPLLREVLPNYHVACHFSEEFIKGGSF